jgi:hypothetical protein
MSHRLGSSLSFEPTRKMLPRSWTVDHRVNAGVIGKGIEPRSRVHVEISGFRRLISNLTAIAVGRTHGLCYLRNTQACPNGLNTAFRVRLSRQGPS